MSELLFSFQGRINRQPFWLASIAVGIATNALIWGLASALGLMPEMTPTTMPDGTMMMSAPMGPGFVVLMLVVMVPALWIGLALQIKRWHDRSKSGWWVFIGLVPVIGGLWVLIECGFLRGTPGPNAYGPDPLSA
ncbi:DUF805 domain-containing protein [Zavarzinia sp.]|uniref:DUF805 domain-containing protein n=1 Tax=Zavarzinia sp. TaxID=2027920 RepID=UPI00356264B9